MPVIRSVLISLLLVLALPAKGTDLDWLAGHWCNETSEELWLPERGGLMLGVNRSTRGANTFFEFLRIEIEGDQARYLAQPGGRGPTAFTRSASGELSVEFRNPQHDYPRRIRYWRDDDALHAAIDDGDGGREMRFTFPPCQAATE
jgi:hypothetical protein